eukprot:TRINITY_DN33019_c0_g1_i1.p1 TRINITY_DN33019_c0_g1~~TRINITY_DN33019_c0_g1_i1.p1  ORF type:complete len:187 (+),score=46.28 TRINITY_DN33019_c0_g1_i1:20-580(+)
MKLLVLVLCLLISLVAAEDGVCTNASEDTCLDGSHCNCMYIKCQDSQSNLHDMGCFDSTKDPATICQYYPGFNKQTNCEESSGNPIVALIFFLAVVGGIGFCIFLCCKKSNQSRVPPPQGYQNVGGGYQPQQQGYPQAYPEQQQQYQQAPPQGYQQQPYPPQQQAYQQPPQYAQQPEYPTDQKPQA